MTEISVAFSLGVIVATVVCNVIWLLCQPR